MLTLEPVYEFEFPDDIKRIVSVCKDNNYAVTLENAEIIWKNYSETMAAGWMRLPMDDDRLFYVIQNNSQVAAV